MAAYVQRLVVSNVRPSKISGSFDPNLEFDSTISNPVFIPPPRRRDPNAAVIKILGEKVTVAKAKQILDTGAPLLIQAIADGKYAKAFSCGTVEEFDLQISAVRVTKNTFLIVKFQ